MLRGIDHLVILVRKLDDAIKTYEGLGFQVQRGGEHPGGTHNALIGFADGSYLELIAFQDPEKPSDHRWYRFLRTGGGLVDFALQSDDVERDIPRISAAGLEYVARPGARKRPDGQEIAWRMGWPPQTRSAELPFIIDDVTPRELRVPSGEATRHPNGVVGIRTLVVAVRDLDEAATDFGTIVGSQPGARLHEEALEAQAVSFTVGHHEIMLAYPASPRSPLAARIQRVGDGPFQAVLAAEGMGTTRELSPEEAEGARLLIGPAI